MNMHEKVEYDIVVVGAGVSGLIAAYRLQKLAPDLKCIVLEAKDRVGGRTFGASLKTIAGNETVDLGGQWVGTCQPHVMMMIDELGLDVYKQFTEGRKVMQLGNDSIRHYNSEIPSMSFMSLIEFFFLQRKVDKMAASIPINDPSQCQHSDTWDSMTLQTFIDQNVRSKEVKDALDASVRTIFAAEAKEMSLLYFLAYLNAAGGLEPVIMANETSGQEYKIKGSASQIAQILANRLGEDCIHLNESVISIKQDKDSVEVRTCLNNVYKCSKVIITSPPHQTAKIIYDPALPTEKMNFLHRMAPGNIIKIVISYREAFWQTKGFSGEVVTNGGPSVTKGCTKGPLCITFDATTSKGSPALVAFIGGEQHREYSDLPMQDRRHAVLSSFASYFGEKAYDCLDYKEKDWTKDVYSLGGPVCVATPGIFTKVGPALRESYGNLHFAGTESATVWCGFINGAIQSGMRAANEVLNILKPGLVGEEDLEVISLAKQSPTIHWQFNLPTTKLLVILGVAASLGFAVFKISRN